MIQSDLIRHVDAVERDRTVPGNNSSKSDLVFLRRASWCSPASFPRDMPEAVAPKHEDDRGSVLKRRKSRTRSNMLRKWIGW